MKKIRLFLIVLLFISFSTAQAQDDLVDTEFWTGATAKMKVNKKLKVELEQQLRLRDTASTLKSTFSELSLRWTLNKYFKLKGSYRYTVRYGEWQRNRNRISAFLYFKYEDKKIPISFQYRLGFQNDSEVWTGQLITFARNRVKFKYTGHEWITPFLAYESFYRFNNRNEFRTDRYTGGISWQFTKQIEVNGFYRLEKEKNVDEPETQHIGGLMLIYNFKI